MSVKLDFSIFDEIDGEQLTDEIKGECSFGKSLAVYF